jgi:hypothetical protein
MFKIVLMWKKYIDFVKTIIITFLPGKDARKNKVVYSGVQTILLQEIIITK